MATPGPGDRERTDNLAGLPEDLTARSLSKTALILPLDAAIRVLEARRDQGRRLESWEGWVRLPDGARARSLSHGGTFALPRDVAAAATRASETMRRAQERWDRAPEYESATLYFELTFERG